MIELQPVPEAVVDAAGQVGFGVFDGPFRRVNLKNARLDFKGLPLPAGLVRLRLKQWQHVGLVLPEVFVGVALVDAGYLRTTWCFVVDRVTGDEFEHRRMSPLLDLRVGEALFDDHCHVRSPGYRVSLRNRLASGEHRLLVRIDAARGRPAVQGTLRFEHDLERHRPLVVVLPVGENCGMYSHKVALPVTGTLRVGDRLIRADGDGWGIFDVHKAHYPHHTFWNWATFAGRDEAGRAVALNLTRNVNRDDGVYNENGFWLDGELHHLGPAVFTFDPTRVLEPWHLTTRDGVVDLTFRPQGERRENLRLGLVRSVFHQPYGTFHGQVQLPDQRVRIDGCFGVCEDHDALW